MEIRVGPNESNPTHHMALTDGTTKMGLILVDSGGEKNAQALRAYPSESLPFQAAVGNTRYSDRNPRYTTIAQDDWTSGRGNEDLSRDAARYFDAGGLDTTGDGIVLNGMPTYAKGYRTVAQNLPGDYNATLGAKNTAYDWFELWGNDSNYFHCQYVAAFFTATDAFDAAHVSLWIRKVGNPKSALNVTLCSSGTDMFPATNLKTVSIDTDDVDGPMSVLYRFDFASVQSIISSDPYAIKVWTGTMGKAYNDTAYDHWEVLRNPVNGSTNGSASLDGTNWVHNEFELYYRLCAADSPFIATFVEYKDQLYFATRPDDGSAGQLWMNGYRGAADDNSIGLGTLKDSGQTGWTNEEIGNVVKMISGHPSTENRNWRTVTAGASGILTISGTWKIAHTTADDYVVLGSNKFGQAVFPASTITYPISDACVGNQMMFLAQGQRGPVYKFREYNLNGVWTSTGTDCFRKAGLPWARFLKVLNDPVSGPVIYADGWSLGITGLDQNVVYNLIPKGWDESLMGGLIIEDAADAWNEQVIANVTASYTDDHCVRMTIAAAYTTPGLIATEAIASTDIRYGDQIQVKIRSSVKTSAGDLQLVLDNNALCPTPVVTLNIPALEANVWQVCYLDYDASASAGADAIISVGLKLLTDLGAQVVDIQGAIKAYRQHPDIPVRTRKGGRITGLETYGDPENAWVFTEDDLGEISNNAYVPIQLREISTMKSLNNGVAHCVQDVYLWFGLGDGVQRYFRQNLDDVGPNKGSGMPYDRRGKPACLVSFAGRVYLAYNGGVNNYSSVLVYDGSGWHEVYRAPMKGQRIRSIYIQTIDDETLDGNQVRLWINQEGDILWVPISLNPYYDEGMRYLPDGYLTTSWIDDATPDIQKSFYTLKLFTENLREARLTIPPFGASPPAPILRWGEADFQTDDNQTWRPIQDSNRVSKRFYHSPMTEHKLTDANPPDVVGKRIRFRIRLYTTDATITPRLRAWATELLSFTAPKYSYSMAWKLAEGEKLKDLEGDDDDTFPTALARYNKLLEWAKNGTPLYQESNYSIAHGALVYASLPVLQPLSVSPDEPPGEGHEAYIVQFTTNEL